MKRAIHAAMAAAVAILPVRLIVSTTPALGQALVSPGCQELNDPALDSFYDAVNQPGLSFFAGEQIEVTATFPAADPPPTQISFQVEGTMTQNTSFPGSLSYTFPADVTTGVSWNTDTLVEVTWVVSCSAASAYPLAVSAPEPSANALQGALTVEVPFSERPNLATSAFVIALLQAALVLVVRRWRVIGPKRG